MRHGQVLSLDALLSLVLVILVLGTITSTSENLKKEISDMVGWYERANIGDNMLDVLIRSPGDPVNWEEAPGSVRMIGLRSTSGQYIENKKLQTFIDLAESGDARTREILLNISMNRSFLLAFYIPTLNINVTLQFSPGSGLEITGINVTRAGNTSAGLSLPNQSPLFALEYSKGGFVPNPGDVLAVLEGARREAEWMGLSSGVMPMGVLEYNGSVTITDGNASRIIAGILTSDVPSHALLNVTVPEDEKGYAVIVILDGNQTKALGLWKNDSSSQVEARLWRLLSNGSLESLNVRVYSSDAGGILIPWNQIITNPDSLRGEKPVEVWFYDKSFTWVTVKDEANLKILLRPKFEPLSVKLWMWESKR